MDAENLALAQEESTLTKIRTLLNQHKVRNILSFTCYGENNIHKTVFRWSYGSPPIMTQKRKHLLRATWTSLLSL